MAFLRYLLTPILKNDVPPLAARHCDRSRLHERHDMVRSRRCGAAPGMRDIAGDAIDRAPSFALNRSGLQYAVVLRSRFLSASLTNDLMV